MKVWIWVYHGTIEMVSDNQAEVERQQKQHGGTVESHEVVKSLAIPEGQQCYIVEADDNGNAAITLSKEPWRQVQRDGKSHRYWDGSSEVCVWSTSTVAALIRAQDILAGREKPAE